MTSVQLLKFISRNVTIHKIFQKITSMLEVLGLTAPSLWQTADKQLADLFQVESTAKNANYKLNTGKHLLSVFA